MQLSDKFENVLKEICWNDDPMIIGLEDQYMVNYKNNATHIYNVVMYVGMVYMNIL